MPTYNPGSGFAQGSGYGNRPNPFSTGQTEFHGGTDYKAAAGTPIPVAANGRVIYSGYNAAGNGNAVIVEHVGADGSKFYTLYGHMNGVDMPAVGQRVNAGDVIGQVGSTGRSTGPHLHFEIVQGVTPSNTPGGPIGYRNKDPLVHPDPSTFDNWPGAGPYDGGSPSQPPFIT